MDKFCQSCGMPMAQAEVYGTNADGSANTDYCIYCYKQGEFTADISMEQMIEFNLRFLEEMNRSAGTNLTPDEARSAMLGYFPQLKRWKR